MKTFITKLLEVNESELAPVSLLLANSFFIGVFLVSFDVAASTIFLDTYGNEYVTQSFMYSGILGMFFTLIFSFFQRRIPFSRLTLISISIITLIVAAMYIGLQWYAVEELNFICFLFLGPINSIFLLCFYGTVSRSFSLKREKHMTGTADMGQLVATFIAYFAIPLFVSNLVEDVRDYFIGSVISGLLAFIFMAVFILRFGRKVEVERSKNTSDTETTINMLKNPYVRMLALLFFGSVITFIFLEYSFLSVTVEKYTNEKQLENFLGVFGGLVTLVSFILQMFIADRVIKVYGMRISLILIPVVLGLFAILASLIGTFFGYSAQDSSFILFFLFMAMSKLFLQSLKESFEDPIVKNLFIPLDIRKRFDIQTKIEGFFKEFFTFFSGALLTLLGLLSFVDLIFFSYFLVAVCGFYFYTVVSLFIEYRKTLTSALSNTKVAEETAKHEYEVFDVFDNELKNGTTYSVIYTLKLMEKIEPLLAENHFRKYLSSKNDELRTYALTRLDVNKATHLRADIEKLLKSEKNPTVRQLAEKAINDLAETDSIAITPAYIYNLVKSRNPEERILAARLLAKTNEEVYLPHALQLLRDADVRVRYAAVISCAMAQRSEAWPILIEYLSSYTFCNVAASALCAFGENVLPTLEAAFYKTNQLPTIQEKIVQIYGRIQGNTVIELLWNKIDFPDKKIVNNVLLCLSACGFRPQGDRVVRIKQQIETEIGNSAWNVAALTEIPNNEHSALLKQALEEEIAFNFDNIYMLMALIYDNNAVKLVRDNIESGTIEGLVYAIELLDVFLADELKPILFPLIEDIPQSERNERLQSHFPRQPLGEVEVLLQIINRDYNQINKWTKACALYVYAQMPNTDVCDDLVANLFNPDPLIRELSAWALAKKDYYGFKKQLYRLPETIRAQLSIFQNAADGLTVGKLPMSRMEKILFLKQLEAFANVPGVLMVEFVELVEEVWFKNGDIILPKGVNGAAPIFVLVKGKAVIWEKEDDVLEVITDNRLIGENLLLDTDYNPYQITAAEDSLCFKIDKFKFFEQITDNFEIAKEIIKTVSNHYKLEQATQNVAVAS